jgi:hypothetical protein
VDDDIGLSGRWVAQWTMGGSVDDGWLSGRWVAQWTMGGSVDDV